MNRTAILATSAAIAAAAFALSSDGPARQGAPRAPQTAAATMVVYKSPT
jgi:hypothetical protein